jgi:thiol-disulfide isomerase/thioredoxin
LSIWRAGRGIRPALLLVGVVGIALADARLHRSGPEAARGPISVPDPAGGQVDRLIPDTVRPDRDARLLWLDGRGTQPSARGALVLDGTGGVLLVDRRLRIRRLPLELEGREPASIAPASDGGLWMTDAAGTLLRVAPGGRVVESRPTAFSYATVVGDTTGRNVWLVRSAERFAYDIPSPKAPLLVRLGGTGSDSGTLGTAVRPAHVLLADLANAGHVAVGRAGALYYAPFIRDEVIALGQSGDTIWVARRGFPQTTRDPRFEVRGKHVVVDYHPVNLGVAVGPDHRLYVLSTDGFSTSQGRLDVFDPATGRLLRTARLRTTLPTIAVDDEGRVYLLDSFGLLTGVPPANRELAPGFDLPMLRGGRVSSDALKGRVVLLNFWASWCAPCRTEMPALDSLRRQISDSTFLFLGVNEEADTAAARSFLDEFGFDFPVVLGRGRMKERFHYPGLPYTVLLDRDGKIVERWIGFAGPEQLQAIRTLIRAELDREASLSHHRHRT